MSINGKKPSIISLCRAEWKGKAKKTSRPRGDSCAALMAEWRVIYMRLEKNLAQDASMAEDGRDTPKASATAERILLSVRIVGLPRSESARCRFWEEMPTALDRAENPIPAPTMQRSVRRAYRKSPSKRPATAPLKSSAANPGSLRMRRLIISSYEVAEEIFIVVAPFLNCSLAKTRGPLLCRDDALGILEWNDGLKRLRAAIAKGKLLLVARL